MDRQIESESMKTFLCNTVKWLTVAAIGLSAGWVFQNRRSGKADLAVGQPAAGVNPLSASRNPAIYPDRNLAALLRGIHSRGLLPEEAAKGIAGMTVAGLKEILQDSTMWTVEVDNPAAELLRHEALEYAADELFRREGIRSIEWAATLENDETDIFGLILIRGLCAEPAIAAPWIQQRADERRYAWAIRTVEAAYAKACGSNPAAALEMERLFADDFLNGSPGMIPQIDPGIDYAAFITHSQSVYAASTAATYWTATDPAAATASLEGLIQTKPWLLGAMMTGMLRSTDKDETTRWVAEKIENLPADVRQRALAGLNGSYPFTTAEHVAAVMEALRNEDDRLFYAQRTASGNLVRGGEAFLQAVTLAGGLEQQMQVLTGTAREITKQSGYEAGENPAIPAMAKALERLQMKEADKAAVMKIMTSDPP